jgi:16S rRNA (adenine1518-N6/adenine1519-N6)-dimethyltransferase
MARQRLGQHFLASAAWRNRILETLPKQPEETWVEIGPGHGEMTKLLAAPDRHVFAIEADPQLAANLQRNAQIEPEKWPGLSVVQGDVLQQDLAKLTHSERFRVYGNLPYYITSPILHHLFAFADRIASIHIVVQWEVAARIAAKPGRREYGYLSAACRFYSQPEIVFRIPPGAFRPPPRVMSALVRMDLPGERASLAITDEERFLKFVQLCFSQKRKTLRNNLRGTYKEEEIQAAIDPFQIPPDARAEQLTLAQFAAVYSQLEGNTSAST